MKKFTRVLVALALPVALSACNKSADDPVENIEQAQNDPALQGKTFRGECNLKLLDGIATGIATAGQASIKSAREDYEFLGARVTHTTRTYNSTDCSGEASIIYRETGIATIAEATSPTDQAKTIDFEMEKLTVQVADDNGKKVAEEIRLCGSDNWADRSERDVTTQAVNATCYRKEVPNKDANIYRIEGKTLTFGEKSGVSDVRPSTLDSETKYVTE